MSKLIGNARIRFLGKLIQSGYTSEKEIEKLSLSEALKMPSITVQEMRLLVELQRAIKNGKVISFLSGRGSNNWPSSEPGEGAGE